MEEVTGREMMSISAARLLPDGCVCFVGIGIPSEAANLARLTHAPNIVLIYESGTIGAKPTELPLSIGDPELATTADTVVPTAEVFSCWLQGGRIDVGFLGAAQVDKFGNLNSTLIGEYARPWKRLPGAGGAPDIAALAKHTLVIIEHRKERLVEQVDFLTSAGFLTGGSSRAEAKIPGGGPLAVVTDLAILRPCPQRKEFLVDELHPGVGRNDVVDATGWDIQFSSQFRETKPPTTTELEVLRSLRRNAV